MQYRPKNEGDRLAWTMAGALERAGDFRAALAHLEATGSSLPDTIERRRARCAAMLRADRSTEPRSALRRAERALLR